MSKETQTSRHRDHSFRNMVLLILFVIGVWLCFEHYPQQTRSALFKSYNVSVQKLSDWFDMDIKTRIPLEQTAEAGPESEMIVIINQSGDIVHATLSGSNTTLSGDTTNILSNTGDQDSSVSNDEINENTGDTTSETIQGVNENNEITPDNHTTGIMSISVGDQTINIEGKTEEEIVIRGSGYRISIQQN